MKKLFGTLIIVLLAARLSAQSNVPVRLALITETGEAAAASDVLTAQLTGNPKIQLLERNEIEKVYREQGLSAANKDYLKLGRILGVDGLLLFDVVRTPQATNLMARLIAVKPGVVLTDGTFPWPLKDTMQWAESVTTYFNSFLSKLTLLAKDAIPISVVNLRSAVPSAGAQETERQLKLLTIQRLSQERQFFVLERQRMQLLSEEKELKSDESAFWDGRYLLEGVVDQNGYSKDTITIDARLTPPKGGAPLLFEVSGNRTNLSEVINRLAAKVNEALKVNSTVKEWNASDEAAQYFDEAKWALRWGVLPEAQAAADSAWALGKHDMDCATVQVKAYKVPPDTGGYRRGEFTNPRSTNEAIRIITEEAGSNRLWGLTWKEQNSGQAKIVQYVSVGRFPDTKNIDSAGHALQLYYAYSRTLPPDEPKAGSDWYRLGIEDLTVASQVLQHFQFVPESQKPVADKLAELRALARSVAGWISQSPSVHDSYFVGDRLAVYDELYHFQEKPSIFSCEVQLGCFWQERPEDGIALYRSLMSSPVFSYIHKDFWLRELQTPRLVAWNENDRQRVPMVWSNFIGELDASTNILLQLEGKALALADADDEKKMAVSFTNLFNCIFENRDALVANPVEVLYLDWGAGDLVSAKTGNGIATDTRESLNNLFYHDYSSKLRAMGQEYRDKTVPAGKLLSVFEKQKQYLKENKPYDFFEFVNTFQEKNYSKAQALEIRPLLEAYKSNLVAQSKSASRMQKGNLMGAIAQVGFVQDNVNRVLRPSSPQLNSQSEVPTLKPAQPARVVVTIPIVTNAPEIVTNIIAVNKFFPIPWERLVDLSNFQRIEHSTVNVTAHHWFEGKLLLNFEYGAGIQWLDEKGNITGGSNVGGPAIAVFNPETGHWDIIGCPKVDVLSENRFYHRSALLRGELFTCDGGQIRKYDSQNQQWEVLKISDGNNYQLFAVNGHLYAANGNVIFEILDGGKSTRILASNRRQPPVSALDTQDLGTPTLFEGPNHSLRVCTSSKIFTWTGNDWHEDSSAPPASSQPEIFADGVLFRQAGFVGAGYQNGVIVHGANGTYGTLNSQDVIFCLPNNTNVAQLSLSSGNQANPRGFSRPAMNAVQPPKPLWKMPANLLPKLPAALRQSDLYLLEDSFAARAVVNDRHEILQENVTATNDFNAAFLCFTHDFPLPQKLFSKFDPPDAKTAAWMFPTTNLLFFGPETPLGSFGPTGFSGGGGSKAGVWIMPVSEIEGRIAGQKQIQFEQRAREEAEKAAAAEQVQKNLLAKYDRNHNGVIDPDEREEALDDPAFIESELDTIDTNHNGWLDPEELAFFDPDKNKILEPKEQAGIDIAEHLLAERLLKKFDANGNGVLDRSEFFNLQASLRTNGAIMQNSIQNFSMWDKNHDGVIDLAELESFMKQRLSSELRPHGAAGAAFYRQLMADPNTNNDPRKLFKACVEFYWRNTASTANEKPAANPNEHVP